VIQKGTSDLNEAMITGESRPVKKKEGDEVIAATINGEGSLRIEVTGTGEKTKLSGIMRLVADAQVSKSRAQHLADRAARILTGVAIVAGVLTLVVWQFLGAPIDFSIIRVVTVWSSPVRTPSAWPCRWSSPFPRPWAHGTASSCGIGAGWKKPGTWIP
jgi:P-type Cu2+ transporter